MRLVSEILAAMLFVFLMGSALQQCGSCVADSFTLEETK